MKSDINICIILDKRYKKKEGHHPVKLRLTYKRVSKYYPTKIDLTEEEFEAQRDCELQRARKEIGTKEYNKLFVLKTQLNQFIFDAESKAYKLRPFSFEAFESDFIPESNENDDIFFAIDRKMELLKLEDRIGTLITYKNTKASLKAFFGKNKLPVGVINILFLKKYEKWMLAKGSGVTTIGFYLRNLRSIMNEMIEKNRSIKIDYPFGNNKYVIPNKKNVKKALNNEDLKKIFQYMPEPSESKYYHYWLFMYLGNGMNPFDMFNLKFKNIQNANISFIRQKTVKTNRTESAIQVSMHPKAIQIITLFGNINKPENFIFPLFDENMGATEKKKAISNVVTNINKYMRRIGKKLEIDKDITTYVARHSFVTKLITGGASITEVKDLVGHTSIATTEKYVASIEDDRIKQLSNTLLDF